MNKDELLSLFQIGASLAVSDKFHIHTASGRLLEVSAETVLAYLRRSAATFTIDEDGNVLVGGVATGYKLEPVDLSGLTTRVEALEKEVQDPIRDIVVLTAEQYAATTETEGTFYLLKASSSDITALFDQ